jgi:1,4-alpha-glucan branching enzyme
MVHKQYDTKQGKCKVTFVLPQTVRAATASIVGDFNNWDRHAHQMKRQADGSWKLDINLECGKEYHFRYLVNGREWHNEWEADRYAVHPLGGENSVIMI